MTGQLVLFGLLTVAIGQVLAHQKTIFCYYPSWSQISPEDINTNYCTHLVFAFAKVSGNSLAPYEVNDTATGGMYYRFNNLKTQNPSLKTLLAVGGWSHGSEPFSAMAANWTNRQEFVQSAVEYLRRYEFDGLDIDWEYPAYNDTGGRDEDKANFAALVKELRKAFMEEARETNKSRLLLTAKVAAGFDTVNRGYNMRSINRNLDYIGVMAYDLHGSWDQRTGHHAGLFTSRTDPDNLSVSEVVNNWARSVSNNKLLVGLPLYGRTWTLADPNNHTVGASTTDRGRAGQLSEAPGFLNYREICDALNENYTREFDYESKAPFAYAGDQWITYDDPVSVRHKMTWICDNGFAGAIVWAIDQDDFNGTHCGDGEYPLLRRIHQCLVDEYSCRPEDAGSGTSTTARTTNAITTASIPTTTTTTTPTTTTTSPTNTTTNSTTTTTTATTTPTSTNTTTTPTSTTTTPTSTPTPTTTTPTPTTTTPTPTTTTPTPTTTTTTPPTTPTSTSTITPIPTTTTATPTTTTTSTTTTPTSTITTPSTTTTTPTTTTTQVSTTTAIPASTVNLDSSTILDPDCPEYGAHKWYAVWDVCNKFWQCVSPNQKYKRTCPQGTAFDPSVKRCLSVADVNCGDRRIHVWNPLS